MDKLPKEIGTLKAIRVFEIVGFVLQPRKKGSHQKLKKPGVYAALVVTHPTMGIGLLKSLIRDAGMTNEQFLKLLDKI